MKKYVIYGGTIFLSFWAFAFLNNFIALAFVTGTVLSTDSVPTNFNCTDSNDPIYGYLSSDHANTTPIFDSHCGDFNGLTYGQIGLPIGVSIDIIEASGGAGMGRHSCDGLTYDECLARADGGAITGTLFIDPGATPTPLPSEGTINVVKTVINDNGGTKTLADFPLFVNGTPVVSGVTNTFPAPITYTVTETGDSNYTLTFSGDCDVNGLINLDPGNNKFCIVTNNDVVEDQVGGGSSSSSTTQETGTINVVKTVINDNGGTKTLADFPLFVNGTPVVSGVTNTFPAPALSYVITEITDPGYNRTFSGDCDVNGLINLNPGNNKFCIVTNDDAGAAVIAPPVPPIIAVLKVPSPLALPAGPGLVTYTYTLRNIGTVPATDITMVGDTCSPIDLISGDANTDAILDVGETWTYNCSITLSQTHTNTIVATGWANGLSAIDIAIATVVVGVPGLPETGAITPPLIHVIKVPNPLTLPAEGGMVTYTETVTNPGKVALNNIHVNDDKCGPLKYISGDTDKDSRLDTTETWTYNCQSNLTQTTTNTVTASGKANGLTVRDFAVVTVVVAAVPALPSTGFIFDNWSIFWMLLVFACVFTALILLYLFTRRKKGANSNLPDIQSTETTKDVRGWNHKN